MGFVHLQAKSGYSFLKSTLSVEKLVKGAKAKGFKAIALTDDLVLHGAIQFYQQCLQEDIKPLIGLKVKFNIEDSASIFEAIFLAKSNEGYESLVKLSTYIGKMESETISQHDIQSMVKDVFVIIPGYQETRVFTEDFKMLQSVLHSFEQSVPRNLLYIGVQDHGLLDEKRTNELVKQFCTDKGYQAVALQDIRYLNEDDYVAFDCLQFMKDGKHWTINKEMTESNHRHLTTEAEMEHKFLDFWPEALTNTELIAEQCNVMFEFDKQYLPAYPTPYGLTSHVYLTKLCEENIGNRYEANDLAKARNRLQYELKIIENMGFSDYFLIVWDFIKYAKENQILTGPGRGSAAGSIVAFLLNITEVDPLKYNLLFERFLNPDRANMPDIDVDFSDYRRDEVIQYVQEKYGSDHVAQIITFGTFAARSLLRELIKTMSIDQEDAQFLLREVSHQSSSLSSALQESESLMNYVKQSKKLQLLFRIAVKLEGLPRHHSTHAAGVVISKIPLTKIVPVIKGHQDISLTQFPMNDLEKIGLLKMDFLGLRNLSLIEQIVKRIKKDKNSTLSLEHIPLHDEMTFSLLQAGKTTGVFQLESSGMRNVLKELKPTRFEDIVAVNALYRPGPMDFIPTYINRKHGKEKVEYLHPDLKPILQSTFGVLVYQEQIMQIANQFAGLSLGEADLLRRAISKKNKQVIEEEKQRFINGCTRKGYKEDIAREVYDWIVRFANYGFNKSHAVAYSMISYQLAYLKAHYPSHFFAALLTSVEYDQGKVSQYVREVKEMGTQILPPSINYSSSIFTVENTHSIRIALPVIKGVGKQAVDAILTARGNQYFSSLFDFCQRVPLKVVNRGIIENLILAGAFDEFKVNRASLLASIDQAMEQGELFGGLLDSSTLFGNDFMLEASYTEMEPFPPLKQLAYEKDVLGMYISSHPLATYRESLRNIGILPIAIMKERFIGHNAKVVVAVQEVKVIRTKRGDQMAFTIFGDETDEIEGVLFPDTYRDAKRWLTEEMLLFIKGKMEIRNGKAQILVNDISPFKQELLSSNPEYRLYIKLSNGNEVEQLAFIKEMSEKFPGAAPVIVHSPTRNETIKLASQYNILPKNICIKKFKNFFGEGNVVLKKKT